MRSKYFEIHELVPKHLYENVHEDLLWSMLDDKLIETIDKIKETFNDGTMTINNYKWGGDREWSGIRTKDSKYYSETSQHSIGKATDSVFSKYTIIEVRNHILNNSNDFPHIGGIELGVSWLHIDTRTRVNNKILRFNS